MRSALVLTIGVFHLACTPASPAPRAPAAAAPPSESAAPPEPPPPENEAAHTTAENLDRAQRKEGEAACIAACQHITDCAGERAATGCVEDCRDNVIGESGVAAQRYAGCVQSLDCPTVSKSVAMDMGPLGLCRVEAARGGR